MTLRIRVLPVCMAALIALICGSSATAQDLAIRGGKVYTMAGPPIEKGIVLVRGGKIAAVGPAASVAIPAGATVLDAAVVTPGLIDARSVVGLSGLLNQKQDQDQLESSSAIQPELRAVDAYNPLDPLVDWLRSFGITTIHTGHAPGELISGQTLIVKTTGKTVEEAMIVESAAVAATLAGPARRESSKSPGTRGKMMAMLRTELLKAQEYQRKRAAKPASAPAPDKEKDKEADKEKEPPERNLRNEVLLRVLNRELPLMIFAQRVQDIDSALRLQAEFKFELWLEGAAEGYAVKEKIKAAGIPIIVHPSMQRAVSEYENLSFENAAILRHAGIPVAFQSGFESYVPKTRVVLFEAGIAAANGLTFEETLAAITIDAAKLLKIDGRVGSLAEGKDADVALYDGDPFEYTTHCVGTVINGKVASSEAR